MKVNLENGRVYNEPTQEQLDRIEELLEYFNHDISKPKHLDHESAQEFIEHYGQTREDIENMDPDDYDVPF